MDATTRQMTVAPAQRETVGASTAAPYAATASAAAKVATGATTTTSAAVANRPASAESPETGRATPD